MGALVLGRGTLNQLPIRISDDLGRVLLGDLVPLVVILDDILFAGILNIAVRLFLLPADASQQELIQTLRTVNEDSSIHGCLLFRPLPPHLDTEAVTSVLAPEKDIDAITTASIAGLLTKSDIGFPPCTATACLELLHYYDIPLKGKKIAMIGKSATVGLPTALLLMKEEATVSVCHIFTDKEDTRSFCQRTSGHCNAGDAKESGYYWFKWQYRFHSHDNCGLSIRYALKQHINTCRCKERRGT